MAQTLSITDASRCYYFSPGNKQEKQLTQLLAHGYVFKLIQINGTLIKSSKNVPVDAPNVNFPDSEMTVISVMQRNDHFIRQEFTMTKRTELGTRHFDRHICVQNDAVGDTGGAFFGISVLSRDMTCSVWAPGADYCDATSRSWCSFYLYHVFWLISKGKEVQLAKLSSGEVSPRLIRLRSHTRCPLCLVGREAKIWRTMGPGPRQSVCRPPLDAHGAVHAERWRSVRQVQGLSGGCRLWHGVRESFTPHPPPPNRVENGASQHSALAGQLHSEHRSIKMGSHKVLEHAASC